MDEITQTVGFRATAEEVATMDASAKASGISRADYVRSKVLAASTPTPDARIDNLEAMIKHAIYAINQVHTALYSIAEAEGKAGRFLSTEELREVYKRVRVEAIRYALEFPERFVAVQAEIAAAAQNGAK